MIEFSLHLSLRVAEANRLKLTKVRLDRFDMFTALSLLDILRREIDQYAQN